MAGPCMAVPFTLIHVRRYISSETRFYHNAEVKAKICKSVLYKLKHYPQKVFSNYKET